MKEKKNPETIIEHKELFTQRERERERERERRGLRQKMTAQ